MIYGQVYLRFQTSWQVDNRPGLTKEVKGKEQFDLRSYEQFNSLISLKLVEKIQILDKELPSDKFTETTIFESR